MFDRALSALIEQLQKQKCAATSRPRQPRASAPGSRHVPASVRREVWRRDGGRCAFVGARGRCTERGFLEFHHVVPFAAGGAPDAGNIELRCRTHNLYEAELFFGAEMVKESHVVWADSVQTEDARKLPLDLTSRTSFSVADVFSEMRSHGWSADATVARIDRTLLLRRPVILEQLIAEDHPARAVWEFVGRLDCALRRARAVRRGSVGPPALIRSYS